MARTAPLYPWLRAATGPLARPFARTMVALDDRVGGRGLAVGAAWGLERLTGRVLVAGRAHLRAAGPLLVVANHPGLSDALALMASIPRPDLRVIAAENDFLSSLAQISRRLLMLPKDGSGRREVSRALAAHLRSGGAALAFPRGEIEPDPDVAPGAAESLDAWSRSVGLFVRMAPETVVVPAIVRGVLSADALRNPLVRLRRRQRDRERLAASLQVAVERYRAVTVRVSYGPPLSGVRLLAEGPDAAQVTGRITAAARELLEGPPLGWETLVEASGSADRVAGLAVPEVVGLGQILSDRGGR